MFTVPLFSCFTPNWNAAISIVRYSCLASHSPNLPEQNAVYTHFQFTLDLDFVVACLGFYQ